eukprot:354498-Chlamydomonas_euryale.AAC.1
MGRAWEGAWKGGRMIPGGMTCEDGARFQQQECLWGGGHNLLGAPDGRKGAGGGRGRRCSAHAGGQAGSLHARAGRAATEGYAFCGYVKLIAKRQSGWRGSLRVPGRVVRRWGCLGCVEAEDGPDEVRGRNRGPGSPGPRRAKRHAAPVAAQQGVPPHASVKDVYDLRWRARRCMTRCAPARPG